jgi:hypothetical protein
MLMLISDSRAGSPRAIIVWIGALVIAAGVLGGALRGCSKRARQADIAGAMAERGMAKIETLVVRKGEHVGTNELSPWALVRFRDQLLKAPIVIQPEKLQEGEEAAIEFRVGKSGTIYIDKLMPRNML